MMNGELQRKADAWLASKQEQATAAAELHAALQGIQTTLTNDIGKLRLVPLGGDVGLEVQLAWTERDKDEVSICLPVDILQRLAHWTLKHFDKGATAPKENDDD